ncbi:hypothetical protein [Azospirillum sp. SYSU D00513]|uniref:hypothetical protein n=1 Tax=Azospirillum sp. SYSU D00513 TaxID=2812561 RepID=UPI001A973BFB|nr:hypothetical protein [Azospirillum sp. SYSU D00513]
MFNFQYQSLSGDLYTVSIRSDDSLTAHVIGQFVGGKWSMNSSLCSLRESPRVTSSVKAGTYSKLQTGELLESRLHYDAILFNDQPLSSLLA